MYRRKCHCTQIRPLEFVREHVSHLQGENRTLKQQLKQASESLTIIRTAQEWALQNPASHGWSPDQVHKMRDIARLLSSAQTVKGQFEALLTESEHHSRVELDALRFDLKKERTERMALEHKLKGAIENSSGLLVRNRELEQLLKKLTTKSRKHAHPLV